MVENGADLSAPGVLDWASSSNNPEIVIFLIERGAPDAQRILIRSITRQDTVMALGILETAKISVDELSEALAEPRTSDLKIIVEKLLKMGAQEMEIAAAKPESEKYVGEFEGDGFAAKLEIRNADLTISFGDGSPMVLEQKDEATFTLTEFEGSLMTFTLSDDSASAFTFESPGRGGQTETYTFSRKRRDAPQELIPISKLLKRDAGRSVENPQNWASFRGNRASGVAEGQFPPTVWRVDENLNLAWKTRIPGLAHASPVVWEDKIYVATAVGSDTSADYRVGLYGDVDYVRDDSDHVWKLFCLSRDDGRVIWERIAHTGVPTVKRHPKGTQANSTPATNGNHVVAVFASRGLICFGMNGKLHWQVDLGTLDAGWFYDEEVQWGHGSSPIIYKNSVIVHVTVQRILTWLHSTWIRVKNQPG